MLKLMLKIHFYLVLVFTNTLFTLCNAQSADLILCNARLHRYGFTMLRFVAGGADHNDDVERDTGDTDGFLSEDSDQH